MACCSIEGEIVSLIVCTQKKKWMSYWLQALFECGVNLLESFGLWFSGAAASLMAWQVGLLGLGLRLLLHCRVPHEGVTPAHIYIQTCKIIRWFTEDWQNIKSVCKSSLVTGCLQVASGDFSVFYWTCPRVSCSKNPSYLSAVLTPRSYSAHLTHISFR